MVKKVCFSGLLVFLITISSAIAETQLTAHYSSSADQVPQTATLLVKDGKLALQDGNVLNGFYDSDRDVVIAIDHNRKGYYEIDRALAAQVGKQVNSVVATLNKQMEKAMAGMSEEQKRAFQSMMPGVLTQKPTPAHSQVAVRRTGKVNKISGIRCDVVEILENRKPVQRLCVAPYQVVGLSERETESLKKLGQFAGQLAHLINVGGLQQEQVNPASLASAFNQIKGIPLSIDSTKGGSARITTISHDQVDNTLFAVPKQYQRLDVMSLLAGTGR